MLFRSTYLTKTDASNTYAPITSLQNYVYNTSTQTINGSKTFNSLTQFTNGYYSNKVQVITGSTTLTSSIFGGLLECKGTTAHTVNLPSAVAYPGAMFNIMLFNNGSAITLQSPSDGSTLMGQTGKWTATQNIAIGVKVICYKAMGLSGF